MGKWDFILDSGWLGAGTGDGQGDLYTSETAGRGGTYRSPNWVDGNGRERGLGFLILARRFLSASGYRWIPRCLLEKGPIRFSRRENLSLIRGPFYLGIRS